MQSIKKNYSNQSFREIRKFLDRLRAVNKRIENSFYSKQIFNASKNILYFFNFYIPRTNSLHELKNNSFVSWSNLLESIKNLNKL